MNPPDLYDAAGQRLPERRHEHRREDDADPLLILGYETWVRRFFVHRGKILMLFTALAWAGGYVFGIIGKTRDLDALTTRVLKLEESAAVTSIDIQSLKASARIQNYVVCSLSGRLDPAGTPDECRAIRQSGLRP